MKRFLFFVSVIFSMAAAAQSSKQVKWTYSSKKIADKTYEVHFMATINANWHLYSQNGGDGPISTNFTFTKNPLLATSGAVKEVGTMKKVYEQAFKSEVRYYENSVDFVQTVKMKSTAKTNLAGKVEFMVCNDHECLPPADLDFSVNVGG
jgi:thiol:disulfide interchange protein DsbD